MKLFRRKGGPSEFELLLLPKDGSPARRFRISARRRRAIAAVVAVNATVVALLLFSFGSQRIELHRKQAEIADLQRSVAELTAAAGERERRLVELSEEAEGLTARLRQLERLSDEVWSLLGESPAEHGLAGDEGAGRGGPDTSSEDAALQTSILFGSASSQARLQLRELEQLRQLVLDHNRRLEHTPSVWPVSGVVSSEFGVRRHPISGNRQQHGGIDIAAARGTPVVAPAAGVVVFAGDRGGYGLTVIIDHDYGIRTLYAHNSRLHVKEGDEVNRGDRIASVGTTGVSTGPHLHYEVIVNGKAVNPRAYLP